MAQKVEVVETKTRLSAGTAGLKSRVHGGCVTVSAMADACGGLGRGNLISSDKK